IGTVKAASDYDKTRHAISWNIQKEGNSNRKFNLKGLVGLGYNKELQGDFSFDNMRMGFLNSFLAGFVSDLTGSMSGKLSLKGSREKPQMTGTVKLNDVDFMVDYTKVYYSINDETVKFTPGEINIGSVTLKDKEGRTGILNGKITHHNFEDISFKRSEERRVGKECRYRRSSY